MDRRSSFEEEVQDDLEQQMLNIVKGRFRKEEVKSDDVPYKDKGDQESMMPVLEKAERERVERIMLNIRPKPQNADPWRQERLSLKVRPMRPRRAAFDLGIPVQETEHWSSGISARQREERRLYERRLQCDEGMTSGLNNNLAETQEVCANKDHPLKQSSSMSSEGSLEEIVLDGKEISYSLFTSVEINDN